MDLLGSPGKTALGASLLFHGALLASLSFFAGGPESSGAVIAPVAVTLVSSAMSEPEPPPSEDRKLPLEWENPPDEPGETEPASEREPPLTNASLPEAGTADPISPAVRDSLPAEAAPAERAASPPESPRLISGLAVKYPYKARKKGFQGRVLCRVWVSGEGIITKAEIFSSSGYDILDRAALAAVLEAEYAGGDGGFVDVNVIFELG